MKVSAIVVTLAFAIVSVHGDLRSGLRADGQNRKLRTVVSATGSIEIDDQNGRKVEGVGQQGKHVIRFTLGDRTVNVVTDPTNQVFSIIKQGENRENDLSDDDRKMMAAVAADMRADPALDTDVVDSTASQMARVAELIKNWPQDFPINVNFDEEAREKEMDRLEQRLSDAGVHDPTPGDPNLPEVPIDGGRKLSESQIQVASVIRDENGHRRLSWSSLCSQMNSWVAVTHDGWCNGWWGDRWDDKTTYNAWISNHPSGPCLDGTYFWKNSQWQCYEPDHDKNVEYAYGDCFGRCGAGCGGSSGAGAYTYDCADHDSCVRFGHSLASGWCNDEFISTSDDALFAPDCI